LERSPALTFRFPLAPARGYPSANGVPIFGTANHRSARRETEMEITREIAMRVRDTVDAGLSSGLGKAEPGKMCIEAAVCFALGLPHSDNPPCVSPAVRSLKIALNDAPWSSRAARASGMRKLALLQLGTDTGFDEQVFAMRLLPLALETARSVQPSPLPAYWAAVEEAINGVIAGEPGAAWAARAAGAAAEAAARDKTLADFAEGVAQVLIGMAVPGVAWLDLLD
jgi:hypothetical protein